MNEPDALRPPERWAHLRWHWLVPHNDYDKEQSREEPEVCEWLPFKNRDHPSLDYWKTPNGSIQPEGAAYLGWRYHRPCDPAAITADPADKRQLSAVCNAIINNEWNEGATFSERCAARNQQTEAVLTALAAMGRGK